MWIATVLCAAYVTRGVPTDYLAVGTLCATGGLLGTYAMLLGTIAHR